MTLAHSISYPVLLLGGILGALLGSNVFRSIWLGKRRGRSSVRNPPTSGSFGRRMLESFFGFLRATFSGGDSFTSNKYCAEKSSPGKLKWWRRSMLPLIFFAVGGAFVGAFPGLV